MNQSQMNRKHMLEATLSFLNTNATLWQSIAKIGEVKNNLSTLNLAIDEAAEEQEQVRQVTIGKLKQELKRTMSEKADIVNDLVEVYALMINDQTLAQTMADSASDLYKMRNDEMLRRVKLIINAAVQYEADLTTSYGLTTEQITDLQADYDQFLVLNGQPREYQIKSTVATRSMEELFAQVNDLLSNQLDNLMKIFKRRDPTFYGGYLKARMVVDY